MAVLVGRAAADGLDVEEVTDAKVLLEVEVEVEVMVGVDTKSRSK